MSLSARFRAFAAPFLAVGEEGAVIQRNVGWLAADRVFRLAVGTVLNVWMIRYLGAQQLGLFSFAQSVVGILAILSQLGLETILVRDLVRRPDETREILGSALGLRLAGAAATFALSVATIALLRPDNRTALALAMVFASIYFFLALDVVESWFQSRTRVAPYVVARSVAFVLSSIAKTWALIAGAPIVVLAMTMAGEYVLAAVGLALAYRRQGDAPAGWCWRPAVASQLLRDAWPLVLNGAAVMLSIRIDQAMLTLMRSEHENGIYAAAQRLTEILFFIPVAFMNAAAPALLRSHRRDRAEYDRRLQRVFFVLTWTAVGIALPVSLLARPIVTTLFGPEFADSGPVLALHIWSAPALFMGVGISNWFIAEERQRDLMVRSIIAAAANVALNLWLIPAFGARGAALATLAAQTLAYWLANAAFAPTRGLFRLQCRALLRGTPRRD
ncbi:MAG: flippase [Candidatus Eisenbacteria bacterium]|nr:flippase [Candidatus Eisenbacteria bacterium]